MWSLHSLSKHVLTQADLPVTEFDILYFPKQWVLHCREAIADEGKRIAEELRKIWQVKTRL